MELYRGDGRLRVHLTWNEMGSDLVIRIANDNAHIGAVALGEYDASTGRASTSVIVRCGHKDDVVAVRAAYRLAKETRRPACIVAGIHLDQITPDEISAIIANCNALLDEMLERIRLGG